MPICPSTFILSGQPDRPTLADFEVHIDLHGRTRPIGLARSNRVRGILQPHPRQRLLPSSNAPRIVHEVCPPTGLAATLLITVALATIRYPRHMIRLTGALRAALTPLQFTSNLQLSDDRKHVVQTLALDDFRSVNRGSGKKLGVRLEVELCLFETAVRDGGSDLKNPMSADRCPTHLPLLIHTGINEAIGGTFSRRTDIG